MVKWHERSVVERLINGGLRHAINDHGPITIENYPSASKRIYAALKSLRVEAARADSPDEVEGEPYVVLYALSSLSDDGLPTVRLLGDPEAVQAVVQLRDRALATASGEGEAGEREQFSRRNVEWLIECEEDAIRSGNTLTPTEQIAALGVCAMLRKRIDGQFGAEPPGVVLSEKSARNLLEAPRGSNGWIKARDELRHSLLDRKDAG